MYFTIAADAHSIEYQIGPAESGQWTHYYYCRHDGAPLQIDWHKPNAHRCPECGTVESGEPYDSAWVTIVHGQISRAIQEGLLRPCAMFLIEHKEEQLHNHALLITSAIGALGLLQRDEAILHAGLEGVYGLYDQLERGIAEDGFWYEGSMHYHFYAYSALLHYALLAEGTEQELWGHPKMRKMFDFPLRLFNGDGTVTPLNDAHPGYDIRNYAPYYESAFDRYGEPSYRSLLRASYGLEPDRIEGLSGKRDSVYALLYGCELGTEAVASGLSLAELTASCVFYPVSGLSKLARPSGWQTIVKHSRFGGEHDHMDRLGISVTYIDVPLLIDPGTTAYGVTALEAGRLLDSFNPVREDLVASYSAYTQA